MRRSLASARDGRGKLVLLEANAGLGRSALLEQVITDAQLEGMQVLRGAGLSHSAPFALLRELLQEAAHERSDAAAAVSAAELRARAAQQLQDALIARSALAPTLICVDDAQLADADSLRVLSAFSTSIADHGVSLIVSVNIAAPLEADVRAKL
jgi:hypothetical protein